MHLKNSKNPRTQHSTNLYVNRKTKIRKAHKCCYKKCTERAALLKIDIRETLRQKHNVCQTGEHRFKPESQ